ncbi:MAG: alpha/beta fold hydrolase, partial [bacterium]
MGDLGLTLELLSIAAALVILPLLAGALYQIAGAARDARRFRPPGRLVETGSGRLYIHEEGEGAPAVIFEAGIAATSLSWALVQPKTAQRTCTVSYDRLGLGWSDAAKAPRDLARVVEELRAGLDGAGIAAPRILVAHSYGGLVARAYAMRYRAELAGLVLVDPVAAGEWAHPSERLRRMLGRAAGLSRRGALLARLGVVRLALRLLAGGARRLPKMVARASSGGGVTFTERMVGEIRKLPRDLWPVVQAHWCDPKCFRAMAEYLESLPGAARLASLENLGDIPLVVLSAGDSSPDQRAEHERLALLSSRGRLAIVPDSNHWIQLDRPDVVLRAIEET